MMSVKAPLRGGSGGENPKRNRDLERRGEDAEDPVEEFTDRRELVSLDPSGQSSACVS